jgi:hypothetical protein
MNILLRYSEQNRGCNVADEVREATLSIPWDSLNAMQRDPSTSLRSAQD